MSESLTAIAYKAGFKNLHDLASHSSCLMGSVVSDEFEMIYFLLRPDQTVDIFGVREPSDIETCALYRFERRELDGSIGGNNPPGRGGIFINKRSPLHIGQTAVDVLESYARQLDEVPDSYKWWTEKTNVTNRPISSE